MNTVLTAPKPYAASHRWRINTMMKPITLSATQAAIEGIQQYIRDHSLTSGDILPSETELCDELNCSRSSVREAMRTLQSLDVVEVRRGQGTFVAGMTLSPMVQGMVLRATLDPDHTAAHLHEVIATREFLELSVVDELMSAHTKESLDSLNQLASNMRTSFSEYGSFMDEDQQFHAALLSPVSNALMRELAGAMWQVYAQLIDICEIPITVDAERTIKNHESIVRALRNKDAVAYREAVQNHYAPLRAAIAQL